MNYCCCCCCCRCCYETEWPPPEWRSPEDDERRMEWRHSPRNTSSSSPSEPPQNQPSSSQKETKTTDADAEEEHSYYSYSHQEETSHANLLRYSRQPEYSPWPRVMRRARKKPSERRAERTNGEGEGKGLEELLKREKIGTERKAEREGKETP